jgi:hypothetical protein
MRRFLSLPQRPSLPVLAGLVGLLSLQAACNDAGFAVVSISPIYGFEDGCTEVKVSGHGFAEGAKATLDGYELDNIAYPDTSTKPLDLGFVLYGRTPSHEPGFVDLIVFNPDETWSRVRKAFYYVACPGSPHVETVSPRTDVRSQDVIVLDGCSLDSNDLFVTVGDSEPLPLSPSCGSARVTFMAPTLPAGAYALRLLDGGGHEVWPLADCDSGDTSGDCQEPVMLVYGGEE